MPCHSVAVQVVGCYEWDIAYSFSSGDTAVSLLFDVYIDWLYALHLATSSRPRSVIFNTTTHGCDSASQETQWYQGEAEMIITHRRDTRMCLSFER